MSIVVGSEQLLETTLKFTIGLELTVTSTTYATSFVPFEFVAKKKTCFTPELEYECVIELFAPFTSVNVPSPKSQLSFIIGKPELPGVEVLVKVISSPTQAFVLETVKVLFGYFVKMLI